MPFRKRKPAKQTLDWNNQSSNAMYATLLQFNKHDSLDIASTMDGGLVIFGNPGAGKSSILKIISLSAMKLGASLIVFCYKKDESESFQKLAKLANRTDVFVYRPMESPFNPLLDIQNESANKSGAMEKLVQQIMSGTQKLSENSGGDSKVWAGITEIGVSAAVTIFLLAQYPLTYKLFEEFFVSLPRSEAESNSEGWQRTNMICKAIKDAQRQSLTESQREDLKRAARWVLLEAASMTDRMRQSISVTIMSGLSVMVRGDIGHAINGNFNEWSPRDIVVDRPGILIIDCDVQTNGRMAEVILTQIKKCVVNSIMVRDMNVSAHPIYFVADEWSRIISEDDIVLMSTLRDKRSAILAATQSIDQIRAACSGYRNPEYVGNTLLGLSSVRIFCSTTDGPTLEFAEGVMSSSPKISISFGSNESDQNDQEKASRKSAGRSQQFSESIQAETPKYLISRLARGGHEHNFKVEAFVTIAGKIFKGSNGKASLKVKFDQILL